MQRIILMQIIFKLLTHGTGTHSRYTEQKLLTKSNYLVSDFVPVSMQYVSYFNSYDQSNKYCFFLAWLELSY